MSEPHPEPHPESHPDPGRVSAEVAALAELTASGVELDGEVQVCESTWVIYGRTSYDGEIVVGEYEDAGEASAVLRAVLEGGPEHDRSVP